MFPFEMASYQISRATIPHGIVSLNRRTDTPEPKATLKRLHLEALKGCGFADIATDGPDVVRLPHDDDAVLADQRYRAVLFQPCEQPVEIFEVDGNQCDTGKRTIRIRYAPLSSPLIVHSQAGRDFAYETGPAHLHVQYQTDRNRKRPGSIEREAPTTRCARPSSRIIK
ncbi:hypothetical protein KDX09_27365 [Burkholderia cenocepacia]|nr:hypothetical protein [Burkholderia cenocepacia]